MSARRPTTLLVAVWLAGVGLATGTGVLAVQLVAQQVGDPTVAVLSSAEVGQQLASASRTPAPSRSRLGGSAASTTSPRATASHGTDRSGTDDGSRSPTSPAGQGKSPTTVTRPAPTHQEDKGGSTAPAAPTGGSSSSGSSDVKAFDSQGGSVGVRCRGTSPEQVYASPAQGYRLDDSSVSGSTLEVQFQSSTTDVRLKISCSSGSPVLTEKRVEKRDDSGGSGSTGGSGGTTDDRSEK